MLSKFLLSILSRNFELSTSQQHESVKMTGSVNLGLRGVRFSAFSILLIFGVTVFVAIFLEIWIQQFY